MMTERYQICIRGHLDKSWSIWFTGMNIVNDFDADKDPITWISGPVIDQARLYGMLCRLRDLGVHLISVQLLPDTDAEPPENENPNNHNS